MKVTVGHQHLALQPNSDMASNLVGMASNLVQWPPPILAMAREDVPSLKKGLSHAPRSWFELCHEIRTDAPRIRKMLRDSPTDSEPCGKICDRGTVFACVFLSGRPGDMIRIGLRCQQELFILCRVAARTFLIAHQQLSTFSSLTACSVQKDAM